MMHDIIGDIHGHADELIQLLESLDYKKIHGVYRHPDRKAVFCGDFIDRGPQIRDVITICHSMCEANAASAVMGNHELNALAFHTPDPASQGNFLRKQHPKNIEQHSATLNQLSPSEMRDALAWFRTLPIALDAGSFRVVHACWDPVNLEELRLARQQFGNMTDEFLLHATRKHDPVFVAIERVLKGPEMDLPEGVVLIDKEGNRRKRARIRWFDPIGDFRCGAYCLPPQTLDALANVTVPESVMPAEYPQDAPPVFFGHYWFPGESTPSPLRPNIACLDYSVAKHGLLCAYRYEGEAELKAENFVTVSSAEPRLAQMVLLNS
ncbi:MAG: metallophosphoesterase [Planctomycetota bacterium]|nr:metallophosphoesterase [Planctomycetota bacterium]